jgi:hypothetical protein
MSFGIRDFEGHGEGRCRSAVPTVRRRRPAETPMLHPASGWRDLGAELAESYGGLNLMGDRFIVCGGVWTLFIVFPFVIH